jgi:hypothetical protein
MPASHLPNFIIGGLTKSGTSSLYEWLRQHPQACAATVKEPRFFVDQPEPGHPSIHSQPLQRYAAYFQPTAGQALLFEASPQYVFQATALKWLPGLASEPRLLFVLREPAARLRSEFRYHKYNLKLVAADTSFAQWLDSRQGRLEQQRSAYAEYLHGWQQALGPARMKLWLFEELVARPAEHLQELSRWLGINVDFWQGFDFTPRNVTVDMRHRGFHRLAEKLGSKVPGALAARLVPLYYRLNARPAPVADTAEQATMGELRGRFDEANRLLASQFKLDISAWQ